METITLGKTGIRVKKLGFGAMYLPRVSLEQSDQVLKRALELGINYFDTSSAYQDSEEKLGRALSSRKKDYVIASRSIAWKMGADAFRKDLEQSLRRLRVERIDFYGVHAVNQPQELGQAMKEPLDLLKEEKRKGRVKHIALTGHNPAVMIEAVRTGEFEMIMFPFNVIEQEPLGGLIQTANQMGVATSVMKPLAGGVIENKASALRFFLNHPAGVVTPGMSYPQEVEANVDIFERGKPLSPEEMKRFEEEVASLGKEFCRRCCYCMPCPQNIMIHFAHMIHMMCYGKEVTDNVAYILKQAKNLQPMLELCDECGECVEKCPYHLPTPRKIKELKELLKSPL